MNQVNEGQTGRSRPLAALTYESRRHALRVLRGAGEPLSVSDLAIELIRRESDHETVGAECERVQELRLSLHHRHLPKLAAAGLVTYDDERASVALTEAGAETITQLDRTGLVDE